MFRLKNYLAVICLIATTSLFSQKTDSLWRVWNNKTLADTMRFKALEEIMWTVYLESQPDSAFYWAQQEYDLAIKTNKPAYAAHALNVQGIVFAEKGDLYRSRACIFKTLEIHRKAKNLADMGACYSNIGTTYSRQHDHVNALKYDFAALKIFEQLNRKKRVTRVLDNIAAIYTSQKDYKTALVHLNRSLKMKRALGDSNELVVTYIDLGILYRLKKNWSLSEKYLLATNEILKKNNNLVLRMQCYGNLGILYSQMKKYDMAISYETRALDIARQLKDPLEEARLLQELCSTWYASGNIQKAIESGEAAMAMAKKNNMYDLQNRTGETLSDSYAKKKQFEKALAYYQLSKIAGDSLKTEETRNAAVEEQLKYDFEKKEIVIKTESEKKMIQMKDEARIEQARKNTWLASLVFLLVLLSLGIVFIYFYSRQRSIISDQKNNILKQKLLVSQMNPHFIFNSLNAIQNYIFKNDSMKAGTFLASFSVLIRMILDYSRKDFITVEAELDFLNTYLGLQQLRLNNKFTYAITVDDAIDPENTCIPPMLAQPFIENAIEHGLFHKTGTGHIDIRLFYQGNSLVYTIEDDGVGIEEAQSLKQQLLVPYESLATVITKERIAAFSQRSFKNAEIEITDKKGMGDSGTGVKIKFMIPFKTGMAA